MTKLRFLVSLITKDNDYQMEQASAANAAAAELGVDAQIVYADNDPITQSTQVLKAIQSDPSLRPNGIVVEPLGATSFPQVAKTAASAGIGWAILSREAEYARELRKSSRAPIFSISADCKNRSRPACISPACGGGGRRKARIRACAPGCA